MLQGMQGVACYATGLACSARSFRLRQVSNMHRLQVLSTTAEAQREHSNNGGNDATKPKSKHLHDKNSRLTEAYHDNASRAACRL